jgi:predicted trehalose synthase
MSENQEVVVEKETLRAEIAFLVVKTPEGGLSAYTEIPKDVDMLRVATPGDIKAACDMISELIERETVIQAVLARLAPKSEPKVEEVSPTE